LTTVLSPPAQAAAGATIEFHFANGAVLSGSTGGGDFEIPHTFFDNYYGGHENVPFPHEGLVLHVSCSETFPGGWVGGSGDFPDQTDHGDWQIASYFIMRELGGGQLRYCGETFAPGRISVVKHTDPSTTDLFSFDLHGDIPPAPGTNGTEWSAFDDSQQVAGNDGSYTWNNLVAGEYTLGEVVGSNPGDYELSDLTCESTDGGFTYTANGAEATFDLNGGETVTCHFYNDAPTVEPEPGQIIVEKVVTAGSDQSTAFAFTTDFAIDDNTLAHGESGTSGDLDAGTYAVSETVPAGWNLLSAVCDDGSDPAAIGLDEGEVVTCTFTNEQEISEPDPETDLEVTKVDLVDPVVVSTDNPTALITYEVTVSNNGPELAENVVVTDTLPASLTYVSSSPGWAPVLMRLVL
jgi:uncharacterized repeat protein (TIGR01451 family)